MSPVTYSRCKIILFVFVLFLIWQTLKFLPGLQVLQKVNSEKNNGPPPSLIPVHVAVYYEALCPDSKNFIVQHLLPSLNKASRLFNVTLVPYGKAKTEEAEGSFQFLCQHGPVECVANKIHACAISLTTDSILQVKYISCMISDNVVPELVGEKCARELAINWAPILECVKSEKGNLLLSNYGKMTDLLSPRMSFVPTVLINHKQGNQAAVLKNFFKEVCAVLNDKPQECN